MTIGLSQELMTPILKWGAITTIAFILLFFTLNTQNEKLNAVIAHATDTSLLLEKHVDASETLVYELKDVRGALTVQNKAIIRLLELSCLKSAETYDDRRACQQAREGQE